MASASNGGIFSLSLLNCEELYNWCCAEVDMDKLIVNLSHNFDRQPLEEDLENQIEKTWQEKKKQYPLLYNGSKFRLKNVLFENGNLVLNVGMTCYRDFICTNMRSDLGDRISSWSNRMFDDRHACFADPIGVNGLVISSDDEAVFLRRSLQVYEWPGKFHTPGGHPEPSELKNDKGEVCALKDMDPKKVAYELFHCFAKEVRDEVNVPLESLSWPCLTGILRSQSSNGRPEMCYFVSCSLSSKEIRECYDKGGPESFESTEIAFIKISDIKTKSPSEKVTKFLDELVPQAKATLHFYLQKHKCGHKHN